MEFSILREKILKPMRLVAGVVERRQVNQNPILSHVLITVEHSTISFTTTDQEVELVSKIEVEPQAETGKITIPFRKLNDVCRALPDNALITISTENDKVALRSNRSRISLSVLNAEQFPVQDALQEVIQFTINKKKFRHLLEQTAFAMAEQDVRYYFNGMLFEIKNNCLYAVAADGHRMAINKVALYDVSPIRVIIPRKGIFEMLRMVDESDEDITVELTARYIRLIEKDFMLTSKLLEGRFPEYEAIIPNTLTKNVIINRETFKNALFRAAALLSDKTSTVVLTLNKDSLKIIATSVEKDEVEEYLNVQYDEDSIEIGFNVKYLLDCLHALTTETIKFSFVDAFNSALITGVGPGDSIFLVMPRRI